MFASGELSNRRAPGFALPDLGYTHTYDLQDYRGKVVVIDIMSTTCPHCAAISSRTWPPARSSPKPRT